MFEKQFGKQLTQLSLSDFNLIVENFFTNVEKSPLTTTEEVEKIIFAYCVMLEYIYQLAKQEIDEKNRKHHEDEKPQLAASIFLSSAVETLEEEKKQPLAFLVKIHNLNERAKSLDLPDNYKFALSLINHQIANGNLDEITIAKITALKHHKFSENEFEQALAELRKKIAAKLNHENESLINLSNDEITRLLQTLNKINFGRKEEVYQAGISLLTSLKYKPETSPAVTFYQVVQCLRKIIALQMNTPSELQQTLARFELLVLACQENETLSQPYHRIFAGFNSYSKMLIIKSCIQKAIEDEILDVEKRKQLLTEHKLTIAELRLSYAMPSPITQPPTPSFIAPSSGTLQELALIQKYQMACLDYQMHLQKKAPTSQKLNIINDCVKILNDQHLSPTLRLKNFHATLKIDKNKKILKARRDGAFMTSVKILGVVAATIFGLGISGYFAHHNLFGRYATEGKIFLKKVKNLRKRNPTPSF